GIKEKGLHRARVLGCVDVVPMLFSVCVTGVELLEKSYQNKGGVDPVLLYRTAEPCWIRFSSVLNCWVRGILENEPHSPVI
ncbi:hypothetical protein Tco_0690348, partial [Tanacetum coccineum]